MGLCLYIDWFWFDRIEPPSKERIPNLKKEREKKEGKTNPAVVDEWARASLPNSIRKSSETLEVQIPLGMDLI